MLTPQQFRVAMLVAEGKSYRAIGNELKISVRTVEHHVHAAARRVNANTSRPRDTLQIWFLRLPNDRAA